MMCCCTEMKEIIAGLWIGNIHSLIDLKKRQEQYQEIREKYQQQQNQCQSNNEYKDNYEDYEYWTIISLVHNQRLINYTKLQVNNMVQKYEAEQHKQRQNDDVNRIVQKEQLNDTNNATTTTRVRNTATETAATTCTTGSKKLVIMNHILWDLQDTYNTNFLSTKLIDILSIIDTNNDNDNININNKYNFNGDNNQNHHQHHHHTLIHCVQGKSRCVSVCVAYLLSHQTFTTLQDAMDHIRFVRTTTSGGVDDTTNNDNDEDISNNDCRCNSNNNNCTKPNLSFLASLRSIEQCNGNITKAMQRQHSNKVKQEL